ncbi:MAG: hypothetical protein C0603_09655 [Denitrovibrio sp.]|nr:MAG: hypothetical protein C0603_09655 [Denitrovibrio sp.]
MNSDVIKRSPLFQNVSEQTIEKLCKVAREIEIQAGYDIVKDGEMGCCLYLIKSGTVAITKKLTMLEDNDLDVMDKELKHLSAEQNGFFGEMVICSEMDNRSATVTSETDCRLLELSSEDINKVLTTDPLSGANFYRNLAQMLSSRLRKSNIDILKLTTALSLALDE